jgi:hypothetical protein
MAIAAMGACRRAWFVMQRAEEAIVPADNPFAKMGLKKLAPGQKKPAGQHLNSAMRLEAGAT